MSYTQSLPNWNFFYLTNSIFQLRKLKKKTNTNLTWFLLRIKTIQFKKAKKLSKHGEYHNLENSQLYTKIKTLKRPKRKEEIFGIQGEEEDEEEGGRLPDVFLG